MTTVSNVQNKMTCRPLLPTLFKGKIAWANTANKSSIPAVNDRDVLLPVANQIWWLAEGVDFRDIGKNECGDGSCDEAKPYCCHDPNRAGLHGLQQCFCSSKNCSEVQWLFDCWGDWRAWCSRDQAAISREGGRKKGQRMMDVVTVWGLFDTVWHDFLAFFKKCFWCCVDAFFFRRDGIRQKKGDGAGWCLGYR